MCLACAKDLIERQLDEEGVNAVVSDLLSEYDQTLKDAWERESDNAIGEAVQAFNDASTNEGGVEALLAVLATRLGSIVEPEEVGRLTVLTDGIYQTLKETQLSGFGLAQQISDLDRGVIRALSNDGPYWIGRFYSDHMSERIAQVSFNVAVDQGFGREAAGRTLRDVLREEFALRGGSYEGMIPGRFAGNVDNYTRIVSANVTQRSRVYTNVSAMSDAGFQRYIFTAMMDERTSEVCQEMNGRIFTVASGKQVLNDVSIAETPEDFIDAHPWPKNAEAVRVIAGDGTRQEQNRNLEQAGIALPPLHGYCRSVVEALD